MKQLARLKSNANVAAMGRTSTRLRELGLRVVGDVFKTLYLLAYHEAAGGIIKAKSEVNFEQAGAVMTLYQRHINQHSNGWNPSPPAGLLVGQHLDLPWRRLRPCHSAAVGGEFAAV